jgi:hypothetical protein
VSVGVGLIVLIALAYSLYRPRVQQSSRYQAIGVPLANIMDVGFIVFAPAFVLLAGGYAAPLVMLGICLVAIAAGFAIAYNIRHAERLAGTGDRVTIIDEVARWALLAASVVNIAYYTLLLMTLALWPLGIHSQFRVTILGTILLVLIALVGWFGGLNKINRVGSLTTAFNLSAVTAVLVAFLVFNVVQALDGKWELPDREWSITGTEFRQLIGLFAIVQGFEAARYIGGRFGAEERVSAMRTAQIIATIVFVTLLATALILFIAVTRLRRRDHLRGVRGRRAPPAMADLPRSDRQSNVGHRQRHRVAQRHDGRSQSSEATHIPDHSHPGTRHLHPRRRRSGRRSRVAGLRRVLRHTGSHRRDHRPTQPKLGGGSGIRRSRSSDARRHGLRAPRLVDQCHPERSQPIRDVLSQRSHGVGT